MAPVPTWVVAGEKVLFSAVQSIIAAIVVFPLVYWIPAHRRRWPSTGRCWWPSW